MPKVNFILNLYVSCHKKNLQYVSSIGFNNELNIDNFIGHKKTTICITTMYVNSTEKS